MEARAALTLQACEDADDSSVPAGGLRAPDEGRRRNMVRLDPLDHALVRELRADGRVPMAELGRRVGLSRTATLARVRRLEAQRVILGYHAAVDPGAGGGSPATHSARVGIVVRTPDVGAYVRKLEAFDELEEVETVSGEHDLLVRFAADGAARLDAILDRIGGWRETVRTTTFVVLHRYR